MMKNKINNNKTLIITQMQMMSKINNRKETINKSLKEQMNCLNNKKIRKKNLVFCSTNLIKIEIDL